MHAPDALSDTITNISYQNLELNITTGNVTGDVTGDVSGNLTGDVSGNVTGDVTGNLTGDLTGNLTGDVTGNLTGDSVILNSTLSVAGNVYLQEI